MELDSQESPGEIKSREVELGCHGELDSPLLQLFLNSCVSDIVTLLCAAVETAVSEVHKLLCTGGVDKDPHLLVLALADGLFGLHGSECKDELFMPFTLPPSHTHTHTHTHTRARARSRTHARTHARKRKDELFMPFTLPLHTHTHTHTHTRTHARTHARTHTHTRARASLISFVLWTLSTMFTDCNDPVPKRTREFKE